VVGRFTVRALAGGDQVRAAAAAPTAQVTVYRPALTTWYGPGLYGNALACGGSLSAGKLGVANKSLRCGTRVTLRVVGKDEERTFQIVGTNESDPGSGKLSHSSPVGRAVLKRRAGDKVTVITPRGATEYEIVNVEAAS